MSKVKTPREKKRLAYDRDHVSPAEYPHAFRKTWPRKKAQAERSTRRKVRQALRGVGDDGTICSTIRRKKVRKWGSISLRENVQFKQLKRRQMVGARKARQLERSEGKE